MEPPTFVRFEWPVVNSSGVTPANQVNAAIHRHHFLDPGIIELDAAGVPFHRGVAYDPASRMLLEGIPYGNPGTLVNESLVVPPPGNRVRGYLDVAAPDETGWDEIRQNLVSFVATLQGESLPWEGIHGRCFFKLEFDHDLASNWRAALASLIEAAHRVWTAGTPA